MRRSRARERQAIEFAREQRRCANEFAGTVWQWLRDRRLCGLKFRREVPIPPYTVDFCCVDLMLVIEIDGEQHFTEEGIEHDRIRDRFLSELGYRVLRIPGFEVLREDGAAIAKIREFVGGELVKDSPSPPTPLPEYGARGE